MNEMSPKMGKFQTLVKALSAAPLMDRIRSWSSLFGGFDGNRDYYAVFGYKRLITYQDRLLKYKRQDIAGRVVDSEPTATWSAPPMIVADDTFKKAWDDLLSQHDLWGAFNRVDKLAGLGRYAVLFIGIDDGKDAAQPITPVEFTEGGHPNILFLQPFAEGAALIESFETSLASPRFGKPLTYKIKVTSEDVKTTVDSSKTPQMPEIIVHHSRVLHIAENVLQDSIYGTARMDRVFNLLDDLMKVTGGSAETYWLTGNKGMQFDIDKEMELNPEDADDLSDEIDEYYHGLRRYLRTRGVKVNPLGSDVADPRGVFNTLIALISGATGIPQRILLGSEAGQLASEQDRANWAQRVGERRALFAEPNILSPFILMAIQTGILPKPLKLAYRWPDPFKMSPLERAQTAAQRARAMANLAKAMSADKAPIEKDEARAMVGLDEPTPIFDDTEDTKIPATRGSQPSGGVTE